MLISFIKCDVLGFVCSVGNQKLVNRKWYLQLRISNENYLQHYQSKLNHERFMNESYENCVHCTCYFHQFFPQYASHWPSIENEAPPPPSHLDYSNNTIEINRCCVFCVVPLNQQVKMYSITVDSFVLLEMQIMIKDDQEIGYRNSPSKYIPVSRDASYYEILSFSLWCHGNVCFSYRFYGIE